jgi:hypothetical protein
MNGIRSHDVRNHRVGRDLENILIFTPGTPYQNSLNLARGARKTTKNILIRNLLVSFLLEDITIVVRIIMTIFAAFYI